MISLIIPTLGRPHLVECVRTLYHLPFPVKPIFVNEGDNWAAAINIGLDRADKGDDVILMDDDIELLPDTFAGFKDNLEKVDILGFKLLYPNGTIQHAGGILVEYGMTHLWHGEEDRDIPFQQVCHATTSLIYIKRHVLDKLHGMQENKHGGQQFEDVDFAWRALKENFVIGVHPGAAIHHCSRTKGVDPMFLQKMQLGMDEVFNRHITSEFAQYLCTFPRIIT